MQNKQKPEQKVNSSKTIRFFLWSLIGGFCILLFIIFFIVPAIPRPEQFCSKAESDAQTILASISDYFSHPDHKRVTPDQLIEYDPLLENIENPWTFTVNNDGLIVRVTDGTGRCSRQCQYSYPEGDSNASTTHNWDSDVFTFHIKWQTTEKK